MKNPLAKDKLVWKIPPRHVLSDDCVIKVGGDIYHPHKGEWVDIIPVASIRHWVSLQRVRNLMSDTSDDKALIQLCEELAEAIIDWNWTALNGKPLAKPYQNSDIIIKLSSEELAYLINAIEGETPGERKND